MIRRDAPTAEPRVVAIAHRERILRAELDEPSGRAVVDRLTDAGARIDRAQVAKGRLRVLLDVTDFVGDPDEIPSEFDAGAFGCVTVVGGDFDADGRARAVLAAAGIAVESSWLESACVHLVVERARVEGAARELHEAFGLGDARARPG